MQYNRFASDIVAAYSLFAGALAGLYLKTKASSPVTPRQIAQQAVDGGQLMNAFLRTADTLTTSYLKLTTGGALVDADATAEGLALMRALRVIAWDNVAASVRRSKGDPSGLKTILPNQTGAMSELLKRHAEKVEFTTKDTSGRTWKTIDLIKVLARDTAYQLFIEAQIKSLQAQGDLVDVVYPDPAHEGNGATVSLSGAAGHPSLESIRTTVFHPNATAQLAHHVSA